MGYSSSSSCLSSLPDCDVPGTVEVGTVGVIIISSVVVVSVTTRLTLAVAYAVIATDDGTGLGVGGRPTIHNNTYNRSNHISVLIG